MTLIKILFEFIENNFKAWLCLNGGVKILHCKLI